MATTNTNTKAATKRIAKAAAATGAPIGVATAKVAAKAAKVAGKPTPANVSAVIQAHNARVLAQGAQATTAAQGAGTVATTKAAQGTKAAKAATPQAPLFTVGTMPPVRPGTHRAYAQTVARTMAAANKGGFTLAAYKAALVAGAAASSIAPPTQGWAAHNMPTWCANTKQGWLVPVGG